MNPDLLRHRKFTARLDCRYLLHAPAAVGPHTALIVTLHGFGASPELMLPLTARLFGEDHVYAAPAGPYQFFTGDNRSDVGYGWITNRHSESSIRLHHDIATHVLDEAGREMAIPPERRILVGFSQSVSLNYRFAATRPNEVRGVVGLCGAVPSNWETGAFEPVQASVLHLARRDDEFYPPAVTEAYATRLALRAADVEFHLLDGGHRMPSSASAIAAGWLDRILR